MTQRQSNCGQLALYFTSSHFSRCHRDKVCSTNILYMQLCNYVNGFVVYPSYIILPFLNAQASFETRTHGSITQNLLVAFNNRNEYNSKLRSLLYFHYSIFYVSHAVDKFIMNHHSRSSADKLNEEPSSSLVISTQVLMSSANESKYRLF
jgi:hypothetical protein